MQFDVQTYLALAVVAMAVMYLTHRIFFRSNSQSSCGSCQGCSKKSGKLHQLNG